MLSKPLLTEVFMSSYQQSCMQSDIKLVEQRKVTFINIGANWMCLQSSFINFSFLILFYSSLLSYGNTVLVNKNDLSSTSDKTVTGKNSNKSFFINKILFHTINDAFLPCLRFSVSYSQCRVPKLNIQHKNTRETTCNTLPV